MSVINNAIVLLERIHLEITENHLDPPNAIIAGLLFATLPTLGVVPVF